MGRSYSMDLRQRLVERVAGGQSRRGAAEDLSVSASFSVKLVARQALTGSIEPKTQGRPRGTGKLDPYRAILLGRVKEKPDITMPELAAELAERHGIETDPASLSRFLCKAGLSYKKTLVASERARSDVAKARIGWIRGRQPVMRAMPHRLVFIDETLDQHQDDPVARQGAGRRAARRRGSVRPQAQPDLHRRLALRRIDGALDHRGRDG